MPQVVAEFVVEAFELYGTEAAVVTAATEIAVTVAISVAVSKIAQAIQGKPSPTGDPPQRLQTARGTTAYRQLVYGQIKTGGYLAYMGTSGAAGKCLVAYLESE